MSSYTTLLDCSHKQSDEFIGGNNNSNALYTCKLGSGLDVNAGDTISLHNAYISETGSDDNSIQITDKFIKNKTITYTKLTPANFLQYPDNDYMLGYKSISASNITETIDLTENKTTLLYNYYITNHGEIAFHLPRRFVYPATGAPSWDATSDRLTTGRQFQSPCLYTDVGASYNRNFLNAFYCDQDYYLFQDGHEANLGNNHIKGIFNNSRFKIFTQTDTRYADVGGDDLLSASLTSPAGLDYIEYIEKLDIELDVGFRSPEAIASKITNDLRKQSQPQINKLVSSASFNVSFNNQTYRHLNTEINSPTYHTFHACSQDNNSSTTYNAWDTATSDNDRGLEWLSSYQFIGIKRPDLWIKGREFNNYWLEFIQNATSPALYPNVLYSATTLHSTLNASQFRRDATIGVDGDNIHTIILDVGWDNKEYMNKLKDVFIEQGKHPELFENKFNQYFSYTSASNSRFLHLNVRNDSVRNAVDPVYKRQLGTDYLKSNGSVGFMNSAPIFFDFNPAYENIETEGNSWEDGYSYGVFKKHTIGNIDYVALTTSHLDIIEDGTLDPSFTTIPNVFFLLNDGTTTGTQIDDDTRIGWDSHFLSYGNVCVGLNAGWSEEFSRLSPADGLYQTNQQHPTAYNTTEIESHARIQKVYLGANEPLLEYNTTSNRFEISNLHTAERVQNRSVAGGLEGTGDNATLIETFSTAGDKVYKINKRLFNTSWLPDILPYGANNHTLVINSNNYNTDFLNPNLSAWTIYDQYSGIIIKDFGYDETSWTKGFWDTLGFDYIQFNSPETSSNDLTTRVGNDNKNALPYAFTNAEVGQLATMDFPTNVFGSGFYNLQLPCPSLFNDDNTGADKSDYFREDLKFENFPAITEPATSVKLQAPRLPRKLANPYFTIRTDILEDNTYIGGYESGQIYPVIAIIPKSNDYGDYFVSLDSNLTFTFTRPRTITYIKTMITNPDQSLANVDENSAVIYKLTRALNPNRFNIVQQVLNDTKKKPKL